MYNFNFNFFAFESKMFIIFEHYVFDQFNTMFFALCVLFVFCIFIVRKWDDLQMALQLGFLVAIDATTICEMVYICNLCNFVTIV
jgi:hypothetical protein